MVLKGWIFGKKRKKGPANHPYPNLVAAANFGPIRKMAVGHLAGTRGGHFYKIGQTTAVAGHPVRNISKTGRFLSKAAILGVLGVFSLAFNNCDPADQLQGSHGLFRLRCRCSLQTPKFQSS